MAKVSLSDEVSWLSVDVSVIIDSLGSHKLIVVVFRSRFQIEFNLFIVRLPVSLIPHLHPYALVVRNPTFSDLDAAAFIAFLLMDDRLVLTRSNDGINYLLALS